MSKIQEVANIVIAGRAKLAAGAVQAALDDFKNSTDEWNYDDGTYTASYTY